MSVYWSLQFSWVTQPFQTLCYPRTAAHQASLAITNSGSLFKFMSIESLISSNHLILCHPHLLLLSIFPSIKVFSNESVFPSRGPSTGASALASVLPMNIQDQSPWDWLIWSPCYPRYSRVFSYTTVQRHQVLGAQLPLWSNSHILTWLGKVMALLFNMLSRFVIAFLPRSKCLLPAWLQSPFAVILESIK